METLGLRIKELEEENAALKESNKSVHEEYSLCRRLLMERTAEKLAAHHRIKVLRDALERIEQGTYEAYQDAEGVAASALSTPDDTSEIDALVRDAERYRWLRHEHDVDLPLGKVGWKKNDIRNSHHWCEIGDSAGLDTAIDSAIKEPK